MSWRPSDSITRLSVAALLATLALATGVATARGPEEAIKALYAAARAGDDAGAATAAAAVVRFPEAGAVALAASTADCGPTELVWALRCLREIGGTSAKDTIWTLAAHASAPVRAEAVWTARMIAPEAAVALLLRAAQDPDDTVRRRAFDGLADSESAARAPGVLDVAAKGVLDPDTWVVQRAFEVLGQQPVIAGDDGALDRVAQALGRIIPELDDRNAEAAIDMIVRRAGIRSASIVATALEAKKREVVVAGLGGVTRLRLASALPRVNALAKGSDILVATAAVKTLGSIADPASVVVLVDLLEASRDESLTDAVAVALRTITGLLHGTDVAAWRKHLDKTR